MTKIFYMSLLNNIRNCSVINLITSLSRSPLFQVTLLLRAVTVEQKEKSVLEKEEKKGGIE